MDLKLQLRTPGPCDARAPLTILLTPAESFQVLSKRPNFAMSSVPHRVQSSCHRKPCTNGRHVEATTMVTSCHCVRRQAIDASTVR
eukprot:677063-Rhodomonas_salina.1